MNENLKPISELPPFLKFCYTVGMLPTSYRISMTYEEQVLEAIRFIKEEIIPIVNSNALATKELQEKFVELVNYVETYLDNLDVQDEVNNKLDEMAQSGELAELISQYLESQALIGFNNVDDLKDATNLANGSFAKTYGKITYNDKLGAFYKIRTRTNQDVIDDDNIVALINTENLVAEKIFDQNIINLQNASIQTNARIDNLLNEEIILIGDSYLAGQGLDNPETENFGNILMNKLGMNSNNFHIWAEGGSSFTNAGNQGHTWQQIVESKLKTITPENITKIIFAGGYNDIVATTPTQIESAMNNCIDYVKSVLPNATIYIDLLGNNGATTGEGATARNLLKNRIYNVYSKCFRKRAIFLDKGQLALQDYTLYENHANKVHPNAQGEQEIANYLYQSLLKAPCDYRKENNAFNGTIPSSITSSTSFLFAEKLFNNIIKLYCSFNFTLANNLALGYNIIDLGEQTSIKFLRYNAVATGNNSNSNFIGVSDINTSQIYMLPCRMYVNSSNHLILSYYNDKSNMQKIITPGWINFEFDVQSV